MCSICTEHFHIKRLCVVTCVIVLCGAAFLRSPSLRTFHLPPFSGFRFLLLDNTHRRGRPSYQNRAGFITSVPKKGRNSERCLQMIDRHKDNVARGSVKMSLWSVVYRRLEFYATKVCHHNPVPGCIPLNESCVHMNLIMASSAEDSFTIKCWVYGLFASPWVPCPCPS